MSYNVKLEIFEGPMDLLLHLVQKEKIDIYEVSVSKIIDEYLKYIDLMKELDINLTSEFLVMASTLLVIKSRMILPKTNYRTQEELEEDYDEIDSPEKLLQKLDEYQKYKEIAGLLGKLEEEEKKIFVRPSEEKKENTLADLSIDDLFNAIKNILSRKEKENRTIILPREKITVDEMKDFIKDRIKDRKEIDFLALFSEKVSRIRIVTAFIAMLELVLEKKIKVRQDGNFTSIIICRV